MQENVIITFTSDSSDIDPALNKFKQLTAEEKKLAVEATKTEAVVKKQGVTTKQAADTSVAAQLPQKKSIADLAKQYGDLDKVIAEGAMNKSFKAVLKELTQELLNMKVAGKEDTEEFMRLKQVAGELTDTMGDVKGQIKDAGSDTQGLDGVIGIAESVAAGFSLAQGAASLFGASSKDLEKALIPLQSAMAILMGLTQLENAIQKESVQMRVISTLQIKAGAAATSLDSAAKSSNIVVSKGAIVTQKVLNLVQSMSPVMLLVTGVGLLVGVLAMFILAGDSAAEKQEKLNNQMQAGLDISKRTSEHLSELYSDIDKYMARQIALYTAQGKSLEDIQRLEKARSETAVDGAKDQIQANQKVIDNLADYEDKITDLNRGLNAFAKGDKKARVSVEVDGKIVNFKLKDEDQKKNAETLKGIFEEQVKSAKAAIEGKKEAEGNAAVEELERAKKLNESKMKGTIAYYEAVALKAKMGSYNEFKAQKNGIKAKAILDIESVKNSTVSESEKANQIFKINAQLHRDLRTLRDTYRIEQINNQKNAIDAELALIKEGTVQELDLKLKSLEKQKDADLIAAKDNESKKGLITANYLKEKLKLEKEYNNRIFDNNLAAEQATVNSKLSLVNKGGEEELSLQVNLLELQSKAEEEAVKRSIDTEENKVVRIKAINDKLQADILGLTKQRINAQVDAELNSKGLDMEAQRIDIEKQISQSLFFEWGKRADLEDQLHAQRLKAIDDERKAIEKKLEYENSLRTKDLGKIAEYNAKVKELNNSQSAIELEEIQKAEEAKSNVRTTAFDTMSMAMNSYFDAKKERLQQDLEAVQNNYTTDAQEAKTSANKKLVTAEEMNRKQIEIKRQMAKADKEQAIFNATIGTFSAVVNALNTKPFMPFAPIMAALALTQGMIQVKAITSKPLPKYWKGRRGGKGEFAEVGEHGPETMWIPSGASIIPHHKSRIVNEALNIMGQYQIPYPAVRGIQMPRVPKEVKERTSERYQPIDYDKIGKAVAGQLSNKEVHVNMDKKGFSSYLVDGKSRTNIINRNYSITV
jgi:hypothetical protein